MQMNIGAHVGKSQLSSGRCDIGEAHHRPSRLNFPSGLGLRPEALLPLLCCNDAVDWETLFQDLSLGSR